MNEAGQHEPTPATGTNGAIPPPPTQPAFPPAPAPAPARPAPAYAIPDGLAPTEKVSQRGAPSQPDADNPELAETVRAAPALPASRPAWQMPSVPPASNGSTPTPPPEVAAPTAPPAWQQPSAPVAQSGQTPWQQPSAPTTQSGPPAWQQPAAEPATPPAPAPAWQYPPAAPTPAWQNTPGTAPTELVAQRGAPATPSAPTPAWQNAPAPTGAPISFQAAPPVDEATPAEPSAPAPEVVAPSVHTGPSATETSANEISVPDDASAPADETPLSDPSVPSETSVPNETSLEDEGGAPGDGSGTADESETAEPAESNETPAFAHESEGDDSAPDYGFETAEPAESTEAPAPADGDETAPANEAETPAAEDVHGDESDEPGDASAPANGFGSDESAPAYGFESDESAPAEPADSAEPPTFAHESEGDDSAPIDESVDESAPAESSEPIEGESPAEGATPPEGPAFVADPAPADPSAPNDGSEPADVSTPAPAPAPAINPRAPWARPARPAGPTRAVFIESEIERTRDSSSDPYEAPSSADPVPASPESATPPTPERLAALTTIGEVLTSAAQASGQPWQSAHLEWSQAGTQHSGRPYLLTPRGEMVRLELPDVAVTTLAALRRSEAAPEVGTWLSAFATVRPGASVAALDVEHQIRPYWNSEDLRMAPPAGAPVPALPIPTDEQWLSDLAAFPRSEEHTPAWLRSSTAGPGAASAALRERLNDAQYPRDAVVLPGDPPDAPVLQGALEVRQTGSHRFTVGVRDYGIYEVLHTTGTEREACDWLWNLLVAPLPASTPVSAIDLQHRSHAYQGAYAQIFAQLQAGGGALLTTLPPGVALDRFGSLDGVFLFPWATPVPNRSLPPTANGQAPNLYQFVTTAPLHVEAEIVAPWFGQPGGSLRFRIAADGVGVRQLVTARALTEVRITQ